MTTQALLDLMRDKQFSLQPRRVAATITPPHGATVTTTGIWMTPDTGDALGELDVRRREVVYVLAFRRDEVTSAPRGSKVVAAEPDGGAVKAWVVDQVERIESDHVRVLLIPDDLAQAELDNV